MSTKQILIFQEGVFVRRTDTSFPGEVFFGYRADTYFPGALFRLPNRYRFFRSTNFLATEQIPIFQGSLFQISSNR